jgi:predicted metalloprotease with PDZ domain
MSLSGGSVALLVGSETPASAEHGDWVVVHELSHLGTASFVNEGHWLEEGLATYYEPVLRERAGWMREEDLWSHFVSQMPRGLHRPGDPPSLEDRDDIDSTYWGGALFVFLADVRIRAATRGQRSFDDVLRASLARLGDATHAATVAQFLQVGTEATGTPALLQVETTFAVHGDTVDLDQLWASLGIVPGADGHVTLREDAPLAYVRHGIATGRQD